MTIIIELWNILIMILPMVLQTILAFTILFFRIIILLNSHAIQLDLVFSNFEKLAISPAVGKVFKIFTETPHFQVIFDG